MHGTCTGWGVQRQDASRSGGALLGWPPKASFHTGIVWKACAAVEDIWIEEAVRNTINDLAPME